MHSVKYEFKRSTWMQRERRVSAHSWGERRTWSDEVWPRSLKNVDGGEQQEQDCHQRRKQLEGKKLEAFFFCSNVPKTSLLIQELSPSLSGFSPTLLSDGDKLTRCVADLLVYTPLESSISLRFNLDWKLFNHPATWASLEANVLEICGLLTFSYLAYFSYLCACRCPKRSDFSTLLGFLQQVSHFCCT